MIFKQGDFCLLLDPKHHKHLFNLQENERFHSGFGYIEHNDIIGLEPGSKIKSSLGNYFAAFRPTISDLILKFKRATQIIYPKDLYQIINLLDIYPRVSVLEAGIGSGALTALLLNFGANVVGYDLRKDAIDLATSNIGKSGRTFGSFNFELRDIYEGIDGKFERIFLDLPEPWRALEHVMGSLKPGGILVCYLPNMTQVHELVAKLEGYGALDTEVQEIIIRNWIVDKKRARPTHYIYGHSPFLIKTRFTKGY